MKYAFMTFSCPSLSFADVLGVAKRYGYDGVEIRIDAEHAHGLEAGMSDRQRGEMRRLWEGGGVELCCLATSCCLASVEIRQAMISGALLRIDLAADLGCSRIRVFGGAPGGSFERDRAIEFAVDSLSRLADRAEKRKVTVCIETHDYWCDPEPLAEVLRRVDHPRIAANWDIMHPVRAIGRTMEEAHRIIGPWVRHVHFHDGKITEGRSELVPVGDGDIDHRTALRLLAADGYDGFLSGEWICWEPYEKHLPRELATMKRYEAEL